MLRFYWTSGKKNPPSFTSAIEFNKTLFFLIVPTRDHVMDQQTKSRHISSFSTGGVHEKMGRNARLMLAIGAGKNRVSELKARRSF